MRRSPKATSFLTTTLALLALMATSQACGTGEADEGTEDVRDSGLGRFDAVERDTGSSRDIGADASDGAGTDSGSDDVPAEDAPSSDAVDAPDAIEDAEADAGPDAIEDAESDASPDAVPDATADVVPDVVPDVEPDLPPCEDGLIRSGDRCVECLSIGDCGACQVCADNRCVAECVGSGDCGEGQMCEAGCCVAAGPCGEDPVNACGGCETLSASPGSACGSCGAWACTGGGSLRCDEAPICAPSARRCDGSRVEVCAASGCSWESGASCDLCSGGECVECGGDGEPCCASGGCDEGNLCEGGVCARDCGRVSTGRGGSADIAAVRSVEFVNVPLTDVVSGPSGYHIGVDLSLDGYVPGHHSDDPYYGANVMAHVGPISYYKVLNPGGYPFGLFIDNRNDNYCRDCPSGWACAEWCDLCTAEFDHQWANKVTSVSLEVYARDPEYGGLRLSFDAFDSPGGGGVYSPSPGVVTLPHESQARVARVNGFVWLTEGGAAAPEGRFTIDVFSHGPPLPTSTGYPSYGFGSTSTNADGYYNPGGMPFGNYQTFVTDNETGTKYVFFMDIGAEDIRQDFILDQHCFGWRGACETLVP